MARPVKETDPLKLDFRNFLYVVWQHVLPGKLPTEVQYDIAKFLQHGPKRSVIEAFRGVGKSWITSAYVCWLLYCDPQLNILVVSASKTRSDDFSTFTLRLINEMEILAHLRPGPDQRMSKVSFDVRPATASHAPSVKSQGITGQLTGSRADVIIADDVEVANNSDTQLKRDKLSSIIKEFDAILKPDSPVGKIVYLGTPQSEQSIYNVLGTERGYVIRIWPAEYPTEAVRVRYGARLAPFIASRLEANEGLVGQTTDPMRFSDQDLSERKLSYGRSGYALQFMLDTSLSDVDKYPLKLSDLVVMALNPRKAPSDVIWSSHPDLIHNDLPNVGLAGDRYYRPMQIDKDWVEYEGTIMYVDPSGRGKDETAYAVVKNLHGRLFVTSAGGFRGHGYEDGTLRQLLKIAELQQVDLILVEPNYGDGMFAQLLRAQAQVQYPVSIEDAKWQSSQKEARIIDTLEPIMNQHRLIFCESVVKHDYDSTEGYGQEDEPRCRLLYQMTRITRDKGALVHDDRLDALAGAVRYWVDMMSRNTDVAKVDRKAALLDAELERFLEHAIGGRSSSRNFASNYRSRY